MSFVYKTKDQYLVYSNLYHDDDDDDDDGHH